MITRLSGLLLAASLCLAALGEPVASTAEGPADKPESPRTDSSGDPLQAGVVARLGTTRLFQPGVFFLAFSPDDKILAGLDKNGSLRLWEVSSGKELQHFQTPRLRQNTGMAAFSKDGKLVALGTADNTVHVWEVTTGKERHTFAGLPAAINQLRFDPRGRYLAGGSFTGAVQVWDLQENKAIGQRGEFKGVNFLAYSRDGKSLIAVGHEGNFRQPIYCRWEADSGKELTRREFKTDGGYYASFSADGTMFGCPNSKGEALHLVDPATGEERCQLEGKINHPFLFSFSADGKTVTGNSRDGTVRVWETTHGKLRREFKVPSKNIENIVLSTDGKQVAFMGQWDPTIHIFDTATGKEQHTFTGHRDARLMVAFSPESKTILTANRDSIRSTPVTEWLGWSLRQWNPATGKELRVTENLLAGELRWTCFSADGRFLATITHEGTLRLWETSTGKELRNWKVPTREQKFNQNTYVVEDVSTPGFARDGKSLFVTSGRKVRRWDVDSGKELSALNIEGADDFSNARPGPDEQTLLVFAGQPCHIQLLDASSGHLIRKVGQAPDARAACAVSPDGRTIAVADVPNRGNAFGVSLYEIASGRGRGKLNCAEPAYALAFSPDGQLLALGALDAMHLIHLASGREIASVKADRPGVDSMAFSPDGKWLAHAGYANTVLVCDVAALTAGKMPSVAKLTAKDLDALWSDLKSNDGAKSYQAVVRLGASGKESIPFLKERLKGGIDADPNEKRIPQLIADLDDESFDQREVATAALARLAEKAEPALKQALATTQSVEVKMRAGRLLEKLKDPNATAPSTELVKIRLLETVANIRTPEARATLQELAKGDPESRLTQEAKAALKRWDRRGPTTPD
jgi:WD40 repeat protein